MERERTRPASKPPSQRDRLEAEADRAAARTVRGEPSGPLAAAHAPHVQRMCAACAEEELPLQRKAAGSDTSAGLSATSLPARGGGAPLAPATRGYFEPLFGHDLSEVRVHTGAEANRSARDVDALAYTVGSHIVFRDGQYEPDAPSGRALLAHELAHTVQQRGVDHGTVRGASQPGDASERDADRAARDVTRGAPAEVTPVAGPQVARQVDAGVPDAGPVDAGVPHMDPMDAGAAFGGGLTYAPGGAQYSAQAACVNNYTGVEGTRSAGVIDDAEYARANAACRSETGYPENEPDVIPSYEERRQYRTGEILDPEKIQQLQTLAFEFVTLLAQGRITVAEAREVHEALILAQAAMRRAGLPVASMPSPPPTPANVPPETQISPSMPVASTSSGASPGVAMGMMVGPAVGGGLPASGGWNPAWGTGGAALEGEALGGAALEAEAVGGAVLEAEAVGGAVLEAEVGGALVEGAILAEGSSTALVVAETGVEIAAVAETAAAAAAAAEVLAVIAIVVLVVAVLVGVGLLIWYLLNLEEPRVDPVPPRALDESLDRIGRVLREARERPPQPVPLPPPVLEPTPEPDQRTRTDTQPTPQPVPQPEPDTQQRRRRRRRRRPVTLKLPPQKARLLGVYRDHIGRLQHEVGRARDTDQAAEWDNAMDPLSGGDMRLETYCKGANMEAYSPLPYRGNLSRRDILRPRWSAAQFWPDMQVDHRIEMQVTPVGGEDAYDQPWNYELLDRRSNTSAGPRMAANIAQERRDLSAFYRDPSWMTRRLTFDRVIAEPESNSGRWSFAKVRDGFHLRAYRTLTGEPWPDPAVVEHCVETGARPDQP
jgi:uncharacterized protein DUF4157